MNAVGSYRCRRQLVLFVGPDDGNGARHGVGAVGPHERPDGVHVSDALSGGLESDLVAPGGGSNPGRVDGDAHAGRAGDGHGVGGREEVADVGDASTLRDLVAVRLEDNREGRGR